MAVGDGSFTKALLDSGTKGSFGFDPYYRETSDSNKKTYLFVNFEEVKRNGPYDIIRLHHVIEHLSPLDADMEIIMSALIQNRTLLIQTPNPDSLTKKDLEECGERYTIPITLLFLSKGLRKSFQAMEIDFGRKFPSRIMATGF